MTTSYSLAIAEVRRVVDWVWPHRHTVYPVDRYRPIVETRIERKGHKTLLNVLAYLEKCAREERSSK